MVTVPLRNIGASREIRTHNLLLTRQLPYRWAREAFWCLTRASNPHKTDFESVMSAYCINQALLQTTQSRSAFRLLVFMYCTVSGVSLLPFAYHLLLALPQRLER